jgi:hypothetical protein
MKKEEIGPLYYIGVTPVHQSTMEEINTELEKIGHNGLPFN